MKEKMKGQTQQIKITALPDFSTLSSGFGKRPVSAFPKGEESPQTEEKQLASVYQVQHSCLGTEIAVASVLPCLLGFSWLSH